MTAQLSTSQVKGNFKPYAMQDWVKVIFHSYSQVVLLENVISGILILIGIAIYDINLAILSLIANVIGNVVAILMTDDRDSVVSGLYGFNAVLVGIASGVFFFGTDSYIAAIVGALLTTPLTLIINKLFNRLELPGFTFPFIVMTWFLILLSFSGNLLNTQQSAQLVGNVVHPTDSLVFPDILFKGIGEIFLLDSVWSSLVILAAFVVVDWKLAVKIIGVILLTIAIGYIFQVNFATLSLGLMTYNSILTLMGIETFSRTTSLRRLGLVLLGVVFAVLTDMAMPPILGLVGLPTLTFPFVLVTWGMLYMERDLIPEHPN